jgi:5-methylcytosine-specific restriction protein A
MTFSLADASRALAAVAPFEGADLGGLARPELLRLQQLTADLRRAVDVALAQLAGEVARRSDPLDGPGGLARQQGFGSAEQLVASVVGGPVGDGKRLVAAGKVLTGDSHPALAQGIRERGLTPAKAELIASTLEGLPGDTAELEATLTRIGCAQDYGRLKTACRRLGARHDARHLEDRERRQHAARTLDFSEDASGLTRVTGVLGPQQAIAVRTFFDAQVKAAFQARRDDTGDGTPVDRRTAGQIRADALVALATHGLDCESKATGVKATIIVRIDRDDLERDVGFATCDAIGTPISLDALRQVAVDASVLPMVMNGNSEVLDQGREQRLFTWAQRMALAQRDGGCVHCGAPISHCITHHIRWWSKDGRTDLRNGVLLCVRCHTQLHHDHWDIDVDNTNRVWLIPPAHIDPQRQRQPGRSAREHQRQPNRTAALTT